MQQVMQMLTATGSLAGGFVAHAQAHRPVSKHPPEPLLLRQDLARCDGVDRWVLYGKEVISTIVSLNGYNLQEMQQAHQELMKVIHLNSVDAIARSSPTPDQSRASMVLHVLLGLDTEMLVDLARNDVGRVAEFGAPGIGEGQELGEDFGVAVRDVLLLADVRPEIVELQSRPRRVVVPTGDAVGPR